MEAIATWTLALLRLLQLLSWSTAMGRYSLGTEKEQEQEQRPLWILEDGLAKRQREERADSDYATTTRRPVGWRRNDRQPGSITFLVRHEERSAVAPAPAPVPAATRGTLPQRRFMMPHRLQLPHQYVQPRRTSPGRSRGRNHRRLSQQRRRLPVFDNGPGDNVLAGAEHPIFVYNGTRGEMILNTMLSARRYPMQEPVPGQVLYPPSTPMFRPKPIVERFRMPGQRQLLNLTLIPFYAHEAITPTPSTSTSTTTTELPPTTPMPAPYETQLPRSQKKRKRKEKKAKQYNAFHSPQEVVQWQTVLRRSTGDNHRQSSDTEGESPAEEEQEENEVLLPEHDWQAEEDDALVESVEEQEQIEQQETSTASPSSVSPFQIVYFDESLERPEADMLDSTTSPPPQRLSSRYALKREYYAFPVYTLGKLLQPQSQAEEEQPKIDRSARSSSEHAPSTWFILNSRYKGPHHRWPGTGVDNQTKYYTSKYIENAFRPR